MSEVLEHFDEYNQTDIALDILKKYDGKEKLPYGDYLCLIQGADWPSWVVIHHNKTDWKLPNEVKDISDISAYIALPDEGTACNHINEQ